MVLASRLEGKVVGKWTVLKKRRKTPEDNSGAFSSCYQVRDESGNVGFMKAYNYYYAFREAASSTDTLKRMTQDFTYERDLLEFCASRKMRRIVAAIDSGEYRETGEPIPVPFLVFEIADSSLKNYKALKNPGLAWRLRTFHGALAALQQLHTNKIAHQDIKASNILIFGTQVTTKLADLGRATQRGNESRFTTPGFCGDPEYTPIELLYGYCSPEWDTRRYGADFHMMGGILGNLLTDTNLLGMLMDRIPLDFQPHRFGGEFRQALPHIMKAHHEVLSDIACHIPDRVRSDVMCMLDELCHPDPEKRGNPPSVRGTHARFSLLRYISIADRVAKKMSLLY